ncbi:hypothetical protein MHTCC0001_21060 [Flavobacteriaceae bacterium MHTCC 0001]
MLSFKIKTAKKVAKIGAIYRNETAVPIDRYLVDIKNNDIEVRPTNPLRIKSFFLLPNTGMLSFNRCPKVKNKQLKALKNTI